MRMMLDNGNGRSNIENLSFPQTKQAAAIMDCLGRLIPQEGVDYEVEVVFKGVNDPRLSMNIIARTDKGEWWKEYVKKMISKYPPTVDNPDLSIPIDVNEGHAEETNDEKVLS